MCLAHTMLELAVALCMHVIVLPWCGSFHHAATCQMAMWLHAQSDGHGRERIWAWSCIGIIVSSALAFCRMSPLVVTSQHKAKLVVLVWGSHLLRIFVFAWVCAGRVERAECIAGG